MKMIKRRMERIIRIFIEISVISPLKDGKSANGTNNLSN